MNRTTKIVLLLLIGTMVLAFSAQAQVARIQPKALKEMLDSTSDLVIIDVRTLEEYEEGHISGAFLLPFDQIKEVTAAKTIGGNKNRTVVVYCRTGRRSEIAAATLASLGYTKIFDLGSIFDWSYEIVKGPPLAP